MLQHFSCMQVCITFHFYCSQNCSYCKNMIWHSEKFWYVKKGMRKLVEFVSKTVWHAKQKLVQIYSVCKTNRCECQAKNHELVVRADNSSWQELRRSRRLQSKINIRYLLPACQSTLFRRRDVNSTFSPPLPGTVRCNRCSLRPLKLNAHILFRQCARLCQIRVCFIHNVPCDLCLSLSLFFTSVLSPRSRVLDSESISSKRYCFRVSTN